MRLIQRPYFVYLIAALMSIALSVYAGFHAQVINPDGICYLGSAQAMPQGLHIAMHVCGQAQWPFYSWLIFLFSKYTHVSLMGSAYVLNGLFSLISVLAFIAIIQFLSQPSNRRALMWLAALIILLAHEFNSVRQEIIRDHGFWAFYLCSILLFLNYLRSPQWRWALGWGMSLFVATLFRIEGAVFLLLLPFLTLFDARLRVKAFLQLNTLAFLVVAILLGCMAFNPEIDFTRVHELQYQVIHGWQDITQNFATHVDILAKDILNTDSVRDKHLVFLLMFLSWYLVQVINNVSWLYAILFIYAMYRKAWKADRAIHYVLWAYLMINVCITLAFLVEHFFLSKRYLMALSLSLMIWVPFALHDLINRFRFKKRLLIVLFVLLMLSAAGGIVHFGTSKVYIRDAGNWLDNTMPLGAKLYSNDYQLMYHTHRFGISIFQKNQEYLSMKIFQQKKWKQFNYLALRINRDDPSLENWIQHQVHLSPIKVFANARGDRVVIYKV